MLQLAVVPAGVREAVRVSSQRPVRDAVGRGVSYTVHWRCQDMFGKEALKVGLTIYQGALLQVGPPLL